ncbi:hypothetical protein L1987_57091 [Smallanthus sonchifolius]|uniref:Uncharacterized protein n=1 Tax=Smallanthus sonchifolius TaxID=185202 RepID=A0ACB9DBN2_9ASTR|nr:hypothetical protein L1987_57091 [Smallanthus sonchifolius]
MPSEPSPFMNLDTFGYPETATQGSHGNYGDYPGYNNAYVNYQDYHKYIDQIPVVFQPYEEDIKDVLGDGNCGFRATASALRNSEDEWLLIRRLLIDEMVQFETHYRKAFQDE